MAAKPKRTASGARFKDARDWEYIPEDALWQIKMNGFEFIVYEGATSIDGFGPDVKLMVNHPKFAPLGIDFTAFNAEELSELRQLFDKLFELVTPMVAGRDKRAEELSHDSNMPLQRLIRPIPRLVTGKRAVGIDGESLLKRPIDVPDDDGSGNPSP